MHIQRKILLSFFVMNILMTELVSCLSCEAMCFPYSDICNTMNCFPCQLPIHYINILNYYEQHQSSMFHQLSRTESFFLVYWFHSPRSIISSTNLWCIIFLSRSLCAKALWQVSPYWIEVIFLFSLELQFHTSNCLLKEYQMQLFLVYIHCVFMEGSDLIILSLPLELIFFISLSISFHLLIIVSTNMG